MSHITKPISVILKEARSNKGVTLDEVYKATRVHPKILKSLEEGTTLDLNDVYVKSYIKIYAKFLGIHQHELEKYFHPSAVKEKKTIVDAPFVKKANIENLPKLTHLSYALFQLKRFKKQAIIVIVVILALFIIAKSLHIKHTYIKSPRAKAEKIAVVKTKEVSVQPQENKQFFPRVSSGLKLTIFAEEDTWMQIKKDGEVVFKKILQKSKSETLDAKENFELWLANAGTVRIELNGKILEPLGRRGQLLKSVLIDKDGHIAIKK